VRRTVIGQTDRMCCNGGEKKGRKDCCNGRVGLNLVLRLLTVRSGHVVIRVGIMCSGSELICFMCSRE